MTLIIILFISLVIILYSILRELKLKRTIGELPDDVKKDFDQKISNLSKEIDLMRVAKMVADVPNDPIEAKEKEDNMEHNLNLLIQERKNILEMRRNYFKEHGQANFGRNFVKFLFLAFTGIGYFIFFSYWKEGLGYVGGGIGLVSLFVTIYLFDDEDPFEKSTNGFIKWFKKLSK